MSSNVTYGDDPELQARAMQHLPVRLAAVRQHLRVRRPGDDVRRTWSHVGQAGDGLDRPLDALARPEQTPREQAGGPVGWSFGGRRGVGEWRRRAVRDDVDLRGVDVEAFDQSDAGALGHHDDGVGGVAHPLEHEPLVRRRVRDHGVGDHDRRHDEGVQHGEHLVAVGAAVDAVLVLDDRHVGAIEHVDGRGDAVRRGVVE